MDQTPIPTDAIPPAVVQLEESVQSGIPLTPQLDNEDLDDLVEDEEISRATLGEDEVDERRRREGDSSGSDYDTDIEIPVKEQTPFDPWGTRVYLRTCRKLRVIPITSVRRDLRGEVLELRHRGLTEPDVLALCNALTENAVVRTLILEGNQLSPKSCHYFALAMKENSSIENLNLQNTGLDYKCSPMIASLLLKNETIKHVNLSENLLDDCDIPYLEAVIQKSRYIEHLNLSHNSLGAEAAKHLSHSLGMNDVIKDLDLSWNRFRAKDVKEICKGLQENVSIHKMGLAMSGLAVEGARHVCTLLTSNSSILDLDLTCTRLTDDAAFLLGKMLAVNETLQVLRVSQNPMTHIGVLAMLHGIEKNVNSAMVSLDALSVHVLSSTIEVYTNVRETHPKFRLIHGRVVDDEAPLEPLKLQPEKSPTEDNPMSVLRRHLVVKRKKLINVFQNMDLGPDPVLSKDKFKEGLKALNIPLTSAQVERLAASLDSDESGYTDFASLFLKEGESLVREQTVIDTLPDDENYRPPPPDRQSFITSEPEQ